MKEPIILGAGLSGCLAAHVMTGAEIWESRPLARMIESPEHRAVLRFRSDQISKLTGIPFEKVQVRKSIWYEGQEFRLPDIRLTNMYSRKVTDTYHDRSIVNLETVTRWLAPGDFHAQLLDSLRGRIRFEHLVRSITSTSMNAVVGSGYETLYDRSEVPIISTAPLPVLAKIVGLPSPVSPQSGKRIVVHRFRLPGADVNLSMYYPSPRLPVYRASIMKDLLTVECIAAHDSYKYWVADDWMNEVYHSLGITPGDAVPVDTGEQLGKISYDLNETVRKNWILDLTVRFNIYSLGRFAVWKNVLQDDVYQDALRIKGFIHSGSHYDAFKFARA